MTSAELNHIEARGAQVSRIDLNGGKVGKIVVPPCPYVVTLYVVPVEDREGWVAITMKAEAPVERRVGEVN